MSNFLMNYHLYFSTIGISIMIIVFGLFLVTSFLNVDKKIVLAIYFISFVIGCGMTYAGQVGMSESYKFYPLGKVATIEIKQTISHLKGNGYEIPYVFSNQLKYFYYTGDIKIDDSLKEVKIKFQHMKNFQGQERNEILSVTAPVNLIK